ncbi:MAG: bifunctional methylenetetrahydrofolate dehydrogenase/methenyltetrahydrofolate cyclohydrolase FolD [Burkholderiales bacterium]|jgi:methylenetetrahydrofolate dehydrogenase (NADP+)/methenyltetrahydrofolate cyclohydrolase|nr:bifunctional methylenetetrahydrofolate dehydrogenase/methenyltetrahydrofolate cyclohydrolase FolD [Burkholderiales bacterium]
MSASVIDGVAVSKVVREKLAGQVAALTAQGRPPGLAVVIVGDNPASKVYVRNKVKACGEIGMHSVLIEYPADASQAEVLARVAALNADPAIHGILVQLPLPAHFDAQHVLESIAPEKDVDGFHVANAGALATGLPGFWPCTPHGVMVMLDHYQLPIAGREAVVIGRSNIVGKPQALMLLARDATVTICTSKTRDLASHTRRADILVVATGRPKMVGGDMVKPGAVVIDVGINRLPDGKLCGDVDYDSAKQVAGWITPVPGGVGPMTITMLLANTVKAAGG